MFTTEQRLEKLRALPEEIQDLYGSLDVTRAILKIAEQYQIDRQKDIFIDTVGDVMLGFYPKAQLVELIQKNIGTPAAIATQIAADLQAVLTPVPDIPQEAQAATPIAAVQVPTEPQPAAATPLMPVESTEAKSLDIPPIPRYAKPLTDLPRYNDNQQ